MPKVLITDKIAQDGLDLLSREGEGGVRPGASLGGVAGRSVGGVQEPVYGRARELQAGNPGAERLTIPDRDDLTVVPDQRFKDGVVRFLKERSPA